MIEFPDSPTTGDIFAAGGASWRWDGTKWTVDTSGGGLPVLHQGEVLGNPDPADAEAIPADLPLMVRAGFGDGAAGQALLSGGPAVDPAWGDLPAAPTPPILHQGEVLGNPSAPDGGAVAASLEAMLRAALGDGVAGQALLSGGPAVDAGWGDIPTAPTMSAPYRIGFSYVGGVLAASQLLGMHKLARAVTLPANFSGSQAGGSANTTASTVIVVERALAASPNTFSSIGTITFAAGTITPTFATSGSVALANNDVLRVVGPATADVTFANFYCTIVES